ncbi:hypothetical protein EVAR_99004_1 [Eumeta japonica]|uniref:Uncharacterized protein n=1 Tax=Eumeta variegata TaxID=151549 RepID=A0A4C1Y186_EUMVA|nr:hypothetical protein EVAR_99004_1 [Eumeta japonica]
MNETGIARKESFWTKKTFWSKARRRRHVSYRRESQTVGTDLEMNNRQVTVKTTSNWTLQQGRPRARKASNKKRAEKHLCEGRLRIEQNGRKAVSLRGPYLRGKPQCLPTPSPPVENSRTEDVNMPIGHVG